MIDIITKEFLKGNNPLTIAIVMLVILGIIYLIKRAIDALISKDLENFKSENLTEIEKLTNELAKQKQQLEHMHKISQITYQNLFEKKIDVYQKLIETHTKYIEGYKEKGILQKVLDIDFNEIVKLYIEELGAIENIIKSKKLFISNELLEVYEELILKKESFDPEFAKLALTIYHNHIDDPYDEYGKDKIYQKIYDETKILSSKFHKILDNDVQKIKDKINLD